MKDLNRGLRIWFLPLLLVLAVACARAQKEPPAMQPAPPPPMVEKEAPPPPPPPPVEMEKPAPMAETYTVVIGDNLWDISAKNGIYGDPEQWPLIFKANARMIKDADLIYPGQIFTIPRNVSPEAVAAAIHHAKTRGPWKLGVAEASDRAYLNSGE